MSDDTRDWDDDMDFDERQKIMNYTRAKMGLPVRESRNDSFASGATEAKPGG